MSDKEPFDESPPFTDAITPYDWKHRIAYLWLLDARDDGAEWQEAVSVIFGLDVDADPDYAKRVHDNHLARADWMMARKNSGTDFILRGALACGECGNSMTACWSTSKSGKKHPYYFCFTKGCTAYRKSISRDKIEGEFETLLLHMTPSTGTFDIARAMFKTAWDTRLEQAK